jgi:hypothetical protein
MMNIVKTDIKNMQDIAPLIDDDIIEIYNGKYRRYKRVKKPNFVNGLTEVKINPYNNEREYEFASRQGSREASPNNEIRDDVRPPSSSQQQQIPSSSQQQQQQQQIPSSSQQQQHQNNYDDDDVSVGPIYPNVNTNNPLPESTSNMDSAHVLQILQQLQSRSQTSSQQNNNTIVTPAVSTSTSVRSTSSLQLGQLQIDNSGNNGMNI